MNDKVYKALGIFLDAMRLYVVSSIQQSFPNEPWEGVYYSRLNPVKQEMWNKGIKAMGDNPSPISLIDYHNLASSLLCFKNEFGSELGKDVNKLITWLQELQETRNKCQHYQELDEDDIERAFSNMKQTAKLLEMKELVTELDTIKKQVVKEEIYTSTSQKTTVLQEPLMISDDSLLPSWFNNVIPHYDIRQGALDESVFAANLGEVALGTGREVYRNQVEFFQKTFVTAGLKSISNRVVRALNGEETENRVVSLQTGFGGGKTHTLISLYHIAMGGKALLSSVYTANIFEKEVIPKYDQAKVVIFTDNTTDVIQGRTTDENITIYTLWGEIAYQLGGIEGYNTIKSNDEKRVAPTASLLKPILEQVAPCMILIDELANYCNKASGIKVGGGTLSDQTISFMQALTEVVSSTPRCVLIATLPTSAAEVASTAIGSQILSALENRIVRVGASIKPVDDEEIFEVVRRRLFEDIGDQQIIEAVINRYKSTYHNRRSDLPAYADRMEYVNKMRKSYPFHPELIDMFRLKWGNDSRFQRTRGVLRLLASIVSDLWQRRNSLSGTQALIHTSDVVLSNVPSLTGTITSLMGNQWETVMHADVAGTSSNACKIDNENPNYGKFNLTQGIATTILMGSFGNLQNKGLSMDELKLCVLKPNAFNHNDVDGALNKLEVMAHYLYVGNVGHKSYWFQSKPNINILINQAKSEIDKTKQFAEIIKRLTAVAKSITSFNKVLVSPTSDIPEQRNLSLVIMGPDYATNLSNISNKTKSFIENIALRKGTTDRIYRNTILYLVCSESGLGILQNKILEYLSCEKIQSEYGGQLDNDQRNELRQKKEEADRLVSENLIKAYNIVIKYSSKVGVEVLELAQFAKDFSTQINTQFIKTLNEEEWLIDGVGIGLLRSYNLWPTLTTPIRINEVYEAFMRFDDKPMIQNADAIVKSIQTYYGKGEVNIGYGDVPHFDRIHHQEASFYFDVSDLNYWLVDKSIVNKSLVETPESANPTVEVHEEGGNTFAPASTNDGTSAIVSPKLFKSVTISGKIPIERYTDLFASFVVPLKNNQLEIEVKFKGKSTNLYPIEESSQIYKIIKESAKQLGLNLEEE